MYGRTRSIQFAALIVVAICGTGCDDLSSSLEPDPDDVPMEEILTVTQSRNPPQMPADGISVDTIIASIPGRSSTRKVTFTTTKGSFARRGGAQTAEVRAEPGPYDRLVAKIVLVADTTPGTVTVWAKVGEFSDYVEVELVEPRSNEGGG